MNMLPRLAEAGFNARIVFDPVIGTETPDLTGVFERICEGGFKVIVFQKIHGQAVERLALRLSNVGIKTVYLVCDIVDPGMAASTDATIVVTDYLKSLYPVYLQHKIHTVHDGIENPEIMKDQWWGDRGTTGRRLRAVLVTSSNLDALPVIQSPPDWLDVEIIGRYPAKSNYAHRFREARWQLASQPGNAARWKYLKFLANPRIHRRAWDPVGVYERMLAADIGIIPIDTTPNHTDALTAPGWKVKSENRLTMMMSIGLPVVATPIPSYEPVIQQGVNGFLARTSEEFSAALETLRDPQLRHDMGLRARESVLHRYSMEQQASKLAAVLKKLCT
jgi:glycosyltransferase involved in cell wall biosynthesis